MAAAVALLAAGVGLGYALGRHGNSSASSGEHSAQEAGPAIATFEGGVLSSAEVRARIAEEGPLAREQYRTRGGVQALVEQMLRERLLLLDARRKGYDQDPRAARACEAALSELYLERELDEPERKRVASDEELKAFFEKHRDAYSRSARARIARILLAAPQADGAARARQKAAATALLAELQTALRKDAGAFATAARKRSEDSRTRPLGGELPMLTEAQLREGAGDAVASAVFVAPAPQGLLPQVLETPEGFQLVQVLEREEAREPSFEQTRELLRPRYAREHREQRLASLHAELSRRANVQLHPEALDTLVPAPAVQP